VRRAGVDAGTGLCVDAPDETCNPDGGFCQPRAGHPGVCQSGLSFKPTCFQTCPAPGQDATCLPNQKCVAGTSPGVSICVPAAF
jgi:hypothetical protein